MTIDSDSSTTQEILVCPACTSGDFRATGGRAPGFDCVIEAHTFTQPSYTVRECSQCGLLYRTPTLASDLLSGYYGLVDYRKWEIGEFFPTERAVHEQLRRLPDGARILDFGCSSGRLLAPLIPAYECFGFEINAEAAAAAASKGLRMLPATTLAREPVEEFDAVVAVDVFEHLPAPTALLLELLRLVKPRGALLVVTGNGDSAACRLDPAQFWYFRTVEHLCMLTRQAAEFIARKLDAELEVWEELSHYDTPFDEWLRQRIQHFAFWQFRRKTLFAKTVLRFVPLLERARHWPVAPMLTCSRDHVVVLFRKPTNA